MRITSLASTKTALHGNKSHNQEGPSLGSENTVKIPKQLAPTYKKKKQKQKQKQTNKQKQKKTQNKQTKQQHSNKTICKTLIISYRYEYDPYEWAGVT